MNSSVLSIAVLVFNCLLLLFLSAGYAKGQKNVVYSHSDPVGDEGWVYPTDRVYVRGLFDITNFEVSYDKDYAYFELTFGNITNDYLSPYGFSHQICQIFVDSDRRFKSGSTDSRSFIYNSNTFLTDEAPYEFNIILRGWGTYMNFAVNSYYVDPREIQLYPKVVGNTIITPVPLDMIGTPSLLWAYTVWCGSENYGGFREVREKISQYALSGGTDKPIESQVTDYLAQPGYYKRALYDAYLQNKVPVVNPVGFDIYAPYSVFEFFDPPSDLRSMDPTMQGISSIFDIFSIEILSDAKYVIFRLEATGMFEDKTKQNGFDRAIFQIYADTDNRLGSGSKDSQFNGQFSFNGNKGWEFMVSFDPDRVTALKYIQGKIYQQDLTISLNFRASNKIYEVKIPKTFLEDVPSNTNYSSWYIAGVAGIAESSKFMNLCVEKVCLWPSISPNTSNIIDFLNPFNFDNALIFESNIGSNETPKVPFMSMEGGAMFNLFSSRDSREDGLVEYSSSMDEGANENINGIFDIVSVEVYSDYANTQIIIETDQVFNHTNKPSPIFQVLIDKDNDYWSGSTISLCECGLHIHPENAWEVSIIIDPLQQNFVIAHSFDVSSPTTISNSVYYDGPYLIVDIPKRVVEFDKNSWTWSYAVVSGIRSREGGFLKLNEKSEKPLFSRKYPQLDYDFVDILTGDFNQDVLVRHWLENSDFLQVIFVGKFSGNLLADISCYDKANDEYGTYPFFPGLNGRKGLFDILSFSVQHNEEKIRLATKLQTIPQQLDESSPIGFLSAQIYIDTDRIRGSGCSTTIGSPNIAPYGQYYWEYLIYAYGNSTRLYHCNGTDFVKLDQEFQLIKRDSTLLFDISLKYMKKPTFLWNYVVVSGAVFDQKAGRLAQFTESASSLTFGGGDKSGYGPNVVDVILPGFVDQNTVLSKFNPPSKEYSTMYPIGHDIFVGTSIWELNDVAGDERGLYPKSIIGNNIKGLFDITFMAIMTDLNYFICRVSVDTLLTYSDGPLIHLRHILIHIYIDVDGLERSGSSYVLSNPNVVLNPMNGWEYALTVGPSGAILHKFDKPSNEIHAFSLKSDLLFLEGNTIVIRVPLSDIPAPKISWKYVVFSGMESTTPWKFVPYSDQSTLTTFGGGDDSGAFPNIVDVLSFSKQNQDSVFSGYDENAKTKVVLPYISGLDMLSLFEIEDALMDEFGLYTTDPEMKGIIPSGLLDIKNFKVNHTWTHLILTIQFREKLRNERNYEHGFSLPIISIYCHEASKEFGRYGPADKSFLHLSSPWIWMILINGQGYSLKYSKTWPGTMEDFEARAKKEGSIKVDEQNHAITMTLPSKYTGTPRLDWDYSVFVGLYDETSQDYSLRNREPSTRFLGGGDDDFYDPNIADIVLPKLTSDTVTDLQFQNYILSQYDVAYKQLSRVPSVGPYSKLDVALWYSPDCTINSYFDPNTKKCVCSKGYHPSGDECEIDSKDAMINYISIICSVVGGVVMVAFIGAYFYRKRILHSVQGTEKKLYGFIESSELHFGRTIGSGSYGQVYKGEWRGTEIAIKMLSQKKLDHEQIQAFKKEISIMVELRHPNIVLYMGACFEETSLCIISELMHQGSLYDVLHEDRSIPFLQRLNFMYDVSKGMQYLHLSNPPIIHRDLKSLNILVDDKFRLKVSDFGLTVIQGSEKKNGNIGSLLWLAPEVIEGKEYTSSADVYSFGIISWEIVSRKDPYYDVENISSVPTQVAMNQLRPKMPDNVPTEIQSMINQLWSQAPEQRPTFQDMSKRLLTVIETSKLSANSAFSEFLNEDADPPEGSIALVSCRIFGSDSLWDQIPESMGDATIAYNRIIKTESQKGRGYISQNDGENFLIAFKDAKASIRFCIDCQLSLNKAEWPLDLLNHENAKLSASGDLRGLRCQMAVEFGDCEFKIDEETQRRQFFGKAVSRVIKISRSCMGGQIIITDYVKQELDDIIKAFELECIIRPITPRNVEATAPRLFEICPKKLQNRSDLFARMGINVSIPATLRSDAASSGCESAISLPHVPPMDTESEHVDNMFKVPPRNSPNENLGHDAVYIDRKNKLENLHRKRDWEIENKELDINKESIGSGSYGSVFSGEFKGRKVAIKKVSGLSNRNIGEGYIPFLMEVSMIRKLKHSNIVEFLGASVEQPNLAIIMELVEPGNLRSMLLDQSLEIKELDKNKIITGIISGMGYLHSLNPIILHRDLKSANVLVTHFFEAKICDFGFARVKASHRTMTKCGTLIYQAPEIMKGKKYNEKADVYSFGIVLWEIETRSTPYQGKDPLLLQFFVMNGLRPDISNIPHKKRVSTMQMCWNDNPELRPHFQELSNHLDGACRVTDIN